MIEADIGKKFGKKSSKKILREASTGAIEYHAVPPPVEGEYPPMTDEELERLREKPGWIWGGLFEASRRMFARIDAQDARIAELEKRPKKRTSKALDVTPLD